MNRTQIIQAFIDKFDYEDYLEIGQNWSYSNFDKVNVKGQKESVDPVSTYGATHCMTSDDYFLYKNQGMCWDIIFIDGLHLSDQTERDIRNALSVLRPEGTLVMHDCLPNSETEQVPYLVEDRPWTGDVWKAFAKLRGNTEFLRHYTMRVVDTDYGCGFIRSGSGDATFPDVVGVKLDWAFFEAHRNVLMNVISVEEFKRWLAES